MFRFYYSYDLISELEKELQRDHKMVQLMIDEYDLFLLLKAFFEGVSIPGTIISQCKLSCCFLEDF